MNGKPSALRWVLGDERTRHLTEGDRCRGTGGSLDDDTRDIIVHRDGNRGQMRLVVIGAEV